MLHDIQIIHAIAQQHDTLQHPAEKEATEVSWPQISSMASLLLMLLMLLLLLMMLMLLIQLITMAILMLQLLQLMVV